MWKQYGMFGQCNWEKCSNSATGEVGTAFPRIFLCGKHFEICRLKGIKHFGVIRRKRYLKEK